MNPKSSWDYVTIALRVGLGLWFFVFGLSKVVEGIPAFSRQVASFQILKDPWNMPVAYVIPWFEIIVGLCLISSWLARGASRGALGLTLLFIFVSGQAWVLGLNADCGCFGDWFTLDHGPKMVLLIVQLAVVVLVIATESQTNRKIFGGSQMRLP
jgi:uncharacterized membrane protein YphA (DoxX/SURF4 family)